MRKTTNIAILFIAALANFELPTLNQFLVAAQTGRFPGNKDAGLPLWPKEEMGNFSKKYKDWAPSPWAELPQPAGPFGLGPIPGDSPPAVIRMMHILSGLEDIVAMATAEDLGRSEKLLKTKVCAQLSIPVSYGNNEHRSGLDCHPLVKPIGLREDLMMSATLRKPWPF